MEALLLDVHTLCKQLAIGRTRAYQLIASGELPSVKIGRSVRVPVSALKAWVEKQQGGEKKN